MVRWAYSKRLVHSPASEPWRGIQEARSLNFRRSTPTSDVQPLGVKSRLQYYWLCVKDRLLQHATSSSAHQGLLSLLAYLHTCAKLMWRYGSMHTACSATALRIVSY